MKAIITGFDDIKKPRTGRDGNPYVMIFFKTASGEAARTYLVSPFRNYQHWSGVLSVGAVLDGLRWKDENKKLIDADSTPKLVEAARE